MAAPKTLRDALIEELKDLYHAEKQITKALPKMVKKANNEQLRTAFESHLEETKQHVTRLEGAMEALGKKPSAKKCAAMEGILEEGKEILDEVDPGDLLDAMMIYAAQKVEHYEITSYGTLCTWAELLKENEALKLLKQNMDDEEKADAKLSKIAESVVNAAAVDGNE